jgi:8-oxo-dGTP pyrophosphatase MutT (NUDIX family)
LKIIVKKTYLYGMKTEEISFERLLERLKTTPLGGYAAQSAMEHGARKEAMLTRPNVPENHRKAAVMALLFPYRNEWSLALIVRNTYDGAHSGELSFPGGTVDAADASLQATALRETFEEVGVAAEHITVVRPLTELYIPVSNFLVQPFLGICKTKPDFKAQIAEVAEILKVPLKTLTDSKNHRTKDLVIGHFTLKNVPFFDIKGETLWGATAMMTAELLAMLKDVETV